jgi:hypothetical protein
VNTLEQFTTSVTRTLLKQIDKETQKTRDSFGYGTVNIWNLIQYLATDVLGEVAFGESFRMVEDGNHVVAKTIIKRVSYLAFAMSYPSISKLPFSGKLSQQIIDVSLDIKKELGFSLFMDSLRMKFIKNARIAASREMISYKYLLIRKMQRTSRIVYLQTLF